MVLWNAIILNGIEGLHISETVDIFVTVKNGGCHLVTGAGPTLFF